MRSIVNKIQKLSISSNMNPQVGSMVQTPYGIGKIIAIRGNNSPPGIVVQLEYGTAYININDIKLCN
jgi:hypothetical protein